MRKGYCTTCSGGFLVRILTRSFHISASVALLPPFFLLFLLLHIYFYTEPSLWLYSKPCIFIRNTYCDASMRSWTPRITTTYEFEGYLSSGKSSEASRTDHESDCSVCYSSTKVSASQSLCSAGGALAIRHLRVSAAKV